MTLADLLPHLEAVRRSADGYVGKCPAHDDKHASLSVTERDGTLLAKCHAGCSFDEILAAVKIPTVAAERIYDYRDADGTLVYQVIRKPGKQFTQRRPDGAGWAYNLRGVARVPYRLPELLASTKGVIIVEGERDVDRLVSLGLVATTNSGGAGKWEPAFAQHLAGRRVVIIPDNDTPGRQHAEQVARSLVGMAESVSILELPGLPPKGDVSDWLDAGHSKDDLLRLLVTAPSYNHTFNPPEPAVGPRLVRLADVRPERVSWLWPGWIPLSKITIIDGDPGLGKSTLALDLAARVSTGSPMPGGSPTERAGVVILSAEDGLADTIRPRLDAAGADVSRVVALTGIVTDEGERLPAIPRDLDALEQAIAETGAHLVVVDVLMAYLGDDVNSRQDQDVRRALAPLAAMAERTGAAIVVLRHLNKSASSSAIYRGGGSIGISGAARAVHLVARDPDDESRCILAPVKSNLAAMPEATAFRIVDAGGVGRLEWLGSTTHTAAQLLAVPSGSDERTALDDAKEVLRDILASGSVPAKDVQRAAREAGVSDATLRRAKDAIGVAARKVGRPGEPGRWEWALPEDAHETPKVLIPEQWTSSAHDEHLRGDELDLREAASAIFADVLIDAEGVA